MGHEHGSHDPREQASASTPAAHRHSHEDDHAHERPQDPGGHGHGHAHGSIPDRLDGRFALAIGLNLAFVGVEAVYGWLSNSVALLADAGHNFSDVIGLVAAWAAVWLGRRPATSRYTYGFRRSSVLAALANAVLLLVACGAIAWEAIGRFADPPPVQGTVMMIVAAVGIVINIGAALLLNTGRGDLNLRGAFLHMIADAAVSAGVVVSGALILWTGWRWLDPVVSLAIVLVIVVGTWGLLRDSVRMSLDAVPRGLDTDRVVAFLREQAGVTDVHHVHVWSLSTTETALTAHLVMPAGAPGDAFLNGLSDDLGRRFGIRHSTLQVEIGGCDIDCLPPERN